MTLTVGSLCTGYGGLELAVESVLDVELAWLSEIDTNPAKVCAARFPGVPNLGDLTTIDWEEMYPMAAHRNDDLAQTMYDRYCQGLSIEKVAEEFTRSRQTVWKMFDRRGWDMRARPPTRPSVQWGGRTFSLRDCGYYAATDGARELLHRLVWASANGTVPEGLDVHHLNHDKLDNDPSNLVVMTKAEHTRHHWRAKGVVPSDSPMVDVLTAGYP